MIILLLFLLFGTFSFSVNPPEFPMVLNLSLKFCDGSFVGKGYVYAVDCKNISTILSEKVKVLNGIATRFLLVSKPKDQNFCLILIYNNLSIISNSSINWENENSYYNKTIYFYKPNFKCYKYNGWYYNGSLFFEKYCPGKCEYRVYYWYLNECKYRIVKRCRSECTKKGECINKKLCVKMLGEDDICLKLLDVECCNDEDCNGGKCVGYVCVYSNKSKNKKIENKSRNISKNEMKESKVLFYRRFLFSSKSNHINYVNNFLEKKLNKSVIVFPLNVSVNVVIYEVDEKIYTNITFRVFSKAFIFIPEELRKKIVKIYGKTEEVCNELYEFYPNNVEGLTITFSGYFFDEIYNIELYSFYVSEKTKESFIGKSKKKINRSKFIKEERIPKKEFEEVSRKNKNIYLPIIFIVLFFLGILISYFRQSRWSGIGI